MRWQCRVRSGSAGFSSSWEEQCLWALLFNITLCSPAQHWPNWEGSQWVTNSSPWGALVCEKKTYRNSPKQTQDWGGRKHWHEHHIPPCKDLRYWQLVVNLPHSFWRDRSCRSPILEAHKKGEHSHQRKGRDYSKLSRTTILRILIMKWIFCIYSYSDSVHIIVDGLITAICCPLIRLLIFHLS